MNFDPILDVSEEDLASLDMDAAKNLLDAFAVEPERGIGKDNCLSRIDQWDFDIFFVSQVGVLVSGDTATNLSLTELVRRRRTHNRCC